MYGHFFSEERENAWNQQKKTWNAEIGVWDNLMVKLLSSNYLLIKDKLESTLHLQRAHFQVIGNWPHRTHFDIFNRSRTDWTNLTN